MGLAMGWVGRIPIVGLDEGLQLIEEELQLWGRGNGYTVKKLPVHLPKHFTVRILLRLMGVTRG